MDPGRALASLRALKSQPIPLARTAVEPRPVVAQHPASLLVQLA